MWWCKQCCFGGYVNVVLPCHCWHSAFFPQEMEQASLFWQYPKATHCQYLQNSANVRCDGRYFQFTEWSWWAWVWGMAVNILCSGIWPTNWKGVFESLSKKVLSYSQIHPFILFLGFQFSVRIKVASFDCIWVEAFWWLMWPHVSFSFAWQCRWHLMGCPQRSCFANPNLRRTAPTLYNGVLVRGFDVYGGYSRLRLDHSEPLFLLLLMSRSKNQHGHESWLTNASPTLARSKICITANTYMRKGSRCTFWKWLPYLSSEAGLQELFLW